MSSTSKATGENNFSDFDNSDDDLADLLDDDDDIYAKKLTKTSPSKKLPDKKFPSKKLTDEPANDTLLGRKNSSLPFSSPERKESSTSVLSPEKKKSFDFSSILENSPKHAKGKRNSNEFEGDALSEFLTKTALPKVKSKPTSPAKKSSDPDISKSIEADFDFSKSSSKSFPLKQDDSLPKDDFNSDDDDLLKSLESDEDKSTPNSPRKRSGSFFDDFLKNLSPKHKSKKQNSVLKDSEDYKDSTEDVISEETKKVDFKKEHQVKDPVKKRETFLKQVSFKEAQESQSIKSATSFVSEDLSIKPDSSISSAPPRTARRSEKMTSSKDDDMDWSNFFKESPKKSKDSVKIPTRKETSFDEAPDALSNRRKSSGSEWLGLSEPNTPSKLNPSAKESFVKENNLGAEFQNSGAESTKGISSRPRRPRTAPSTDAGWLSEDFGAISNQENKSPVAVQNPLKDLPGKQFTNAHSDGVLEKTHNKKGTDSILSVVKKNTSIKAAPEKEISNIQNTSSPQKSSLVSDAPYMLPQIIPNELRGLQKNMETVAALPIYNTTLENIGNMQALMNNHVLERDQLIKSSEAMKSMYEERIETMKMLHKDQIKSLEESFKILENNLKTDIENKVQVYETKLDAFGKEKDLLEKSLKEKSIDMEAQHLKEIQKLKDLHNLSVKQMKQDHEEALQRLNRLKDQEVEAILSTQAHSRSLQNLADQLEARTTELANLQAKVEERNQATLREKRALLDTKERDLKALQNRLERQLEDGDEERNRLQQLVLRLENRLQKSATEGEEDRWDVQQLKARLKVQQKYLDEEYKLKMDQIEREKEKLQINQNSLLQEQKIVLLQLAEERQQITREKNELEFISRKVKEDEAKFNVKKLKEESFIEKQKLFIQQEESRLLSEKNNLKMETQQLEREKDMFERDKMHFTSEKERFNEYSLKVKRRADEIEHLAISSREEKERAHQEQFLANKIKDEHQSKLQQIAQQMQTLRDKEHQILQVLFDLLQPKKIINNL
ncbi:fas-binding factor 1 homolog isoform X1 [Parasteatoda tepidariorum]|uniref:fas-binding factor 1 homolog isoform X1 n=1 Tax=Parasteatoda tepidariorum TaxID=114398 RepID=UPI001C725483|nr:fas-binding factor 1 homolog [Parasteatoda tepidariorum]XP_042904875.1 fas-binding factor 1 homolog [Parasteatoda tepidariorum]XP_042904876.1 fas-binding factor 1 homolog [Parasteatoda tepidariorum]XP_042904877.1 fas-binding factor 1 homolog [Parasteatoda tepidariorum]XP_042904878.1 fas-binding factor 1 homolog [Parasteatoda tepidariorum]XP_042904879.1 fas-binding factor 1 homolog [Parasteatoda tepidariorum]XP_042904880.1 fas-binding factor 1 homolog [Parasteatoda tepidariorum]XP_04290488